MRYRKQLLWLVPVDLLVAALWLYGLSYCVCLAPLDLYTVENSAAARLHVVAYHSNNSALASFFAPAHRLDRALRPAYWRNQTTIAPPDVADRLAAMSGYATLAAAQ